MNRIVRVLAVAGVIIAVVVGVLVFSGSEDSGADDGGEEVSTSQGEEEDMKITAEEAQGIMNGDEEYALIDVRTAEEYAEGHIEGAVLIPDYEIVERAEAEIAKDLIVLVYCRSGGRSARAAQTLAELGYKKVYDMGGIIDWPYEIVEGD